MAGPKRYKQLFEQIRVNTPSSILEVGTWNGANAEKMVTEAMKHSDDVSYTGFDLFGGMDSKTRQKEFNGKYNTTRSRAAGRLERTGAEYTLIQGDTNKTLPAFSKECDRKFDFVFIDGGHSIETIRSDWDSVSLVIHEDSVVIFDDYYINRSDAGCKPIIDSIGARWNAEKLPVVDECGTRRFGNLSICLVKVTANTADAGI